MTLQHLMSQGHKKMEIVFSIVNPKSSCVIEMKMRKDFPRILILVVKHLK